MMSFCLLVVAFNAVLLELVALTENTLFLLATLYALSFSPITTFFLGVFTDIEGEVRLFSNLG